LKIQLAKNQKQAVKEAIEKKVMVVTGDQALERRPSLINYQDMRKARAESTTFRPDGKGG